ncbi:MAG: FAD-containing oxidoreductase [Gammaproteobacteria bacterium]|nr:MAG: FAD-containing oxidoreductase [Gammaproteobacteria bacterium]
MSASDEGGDDARWRRLVFPGDYRNPTPSARYNLTVIGAGPAGLLTAIAAAGLGARVALIERHAMGGDCLNVGCVPSKTLLAAASSGLEFALALKRVRAVRAAIAVHDSVERYTAAGVDVFLGQASFVSAHEIRVGEATLRTRRAVIATGARAHIPPLPGLAGIAPLTNETVFDLAGQPRRLAVLGAGPVGCELAQAFARLGTQVELLELAPQILPQEEPEAAERVADALLRDGVRLRLGARVASAGRTDAGKTLRLADGAQVVADEVLVAAGRTRNVAELRLERAGVRADPTSGIAVNARLQTSHPHIYAAGDVCSALQFTHAADAQARVVVRNALFPGSARADRLVMPKCTYTRPELAHVGASSRDLDRAGRAFDRYRVEFGELDRGLTDDSADGYAEVLTVRGTDRILGATIVGKDAGEQLSPVVLALTLGLGLERLGPLVLPYPTRSEYLRRIIDAHARTRLTPLTARTLRWWLTRTR